MKMLTVSLDDSESDQACHKSETGEGLGVPNSIVGAEEER